MQHIDEPRLESNAGYRYQYLAEFIGFGEKDAAAIHAVVGHLAPLIPSLVDATYDKLLTGDATARHFVPRQSGYKGPTPNRWRPSQPTMRRSSSARSTSGAT